MLIISYTESLYFPGPVNRNSRFVYLFSVAFNLLIHFHSPVWKVFCLFFTTGFVHCSVVDFFASLVCTCLARHVCTVTDYIMVPVPWLLFTNLTDITGSSTATWLIVITQLDGYHQYRIWFIQKTSELCNTVYIYAWARVTIKTVTIKRSSALILHAYLNLCLQWKQ